LIENASPLPLAGSFHKLDSLATASADLGLVGLNALEALGVEPGPVGDAAETPDTLSARDSAELPFMPFFPAQGNTPDLTRLDAEVVAAQAFHHRDLRRISFTFTTAWTRGAPQHNVYGWLLVATGRLTYTAPPRPSSWPA
jgi:hypothetical protein